MHKYFFFFSSRRRHTRFKCDWSSDVCSSDLWSLAVSIETAEELRHAMDTASDHDCREMVRAGDDVGDEFGILGIGDGGFEDADDGGRTVAHEPAVEPEVFAEDGRIFPKSGRPETIGDNDDTGSFGTVVF